MSRRERRQSKRQSTETAATSKPSLFSRVRPHWRIMTWVVLAFNLLMLIWIIAGASSSGGSCQGLSAHDCATATDAGKGIAVVLLIVLWALGDVILGTLWLVTGHFAKKRHAQS